MVWTLEHKDDADLDKCVTMEVRRVIRGRLKIMKSLWLYQESAQSRNKWKRTIRLTQVHVEK